MTDNYIPTAEEWADFEKDMESHPYGEYEPTDEDLEKMERETRSE